MLRGLVYLLLILMAAALGMALWAYVLGLSEERSFWVALALAVTGSLSSWWMARDLAAWSLAVRPIEPSRESSEVQASLAELDRDCRELAGHLQLTSLPQLGIYDSDEVNAFVAGRQPRGALLAVSTGLLQRLEAHERRAIVALALARIKNRDVLILPLLYGVISIFSLYPARMFALLMGTSLRTAEEDTPSDHLEWFMERLLEFTLIPGAALLWRHYTRTSLARLDREAAAVVGTDALTSALRSSKGATTWRRGGREMYTRPLSFFGPSIKPLSQLSFHEPLERRVARLT